MSSQSEGHRERERKKESRSKNEQNCDMIPLKIQKGHLATELSTDCRVKSRSRKTNKEAIAII